MKKLIFITALTLAILTFQSAHSQAPVFLGVKGGISIPNLTSSSSGTNDWNEGYSSRIGPNVGILAEFQFSSLFSIQPEINYIGEGGKRKGLQPFPVPDKYLDLFQQGLNTDKDYVFATYKRVSRNNYIQVPIMAKLNFPLSRNKQLKFFVQAGPYVGFLVGAKQVITSDDLKVYLDKQGQMEIPAELVNQYFGTTIDTTVDGKDEVHKVNVGIQGSIGFSYDIGARGKVFIEGGGNYGFLNIQKGDEHGKNHIGAATIALGYAMKLER